MADVNANIGVHIDTSAALAELKNLQRQLATFHSSVAKNSAAAAAAQKGLQTNLLNAINATGKFNAQMGLVRSSTESFTHALETNKLSMREYFRFAGGSTKTFGRLFKQEFNTIGKVAEERVKKMSTQYIKMGRDANGAIKAMSITPRTLDMNDYATKTALAAQKQALLNQLLKQGSTNLLNFGKNTQWAGRQLMVGFTIPLAYFGTAASKTFMDLEAQAVKFKRVYGDMFTTTEQTNKALADIQQLAEEFTKYGVAVTKTMEMAAQAAAMGKTGAELTAQVANATRLAVLGGVEQTQALETTISVTNAFGVAAEDLTNKINFLNAVENQTVVSIEDLTEAIPKAGPVVKQLGGTVEDLAFFLTAMKEGGINASEGANALKSGLASLINPTEKASKMLAGFGVNIKAIVEGNQGNIRETVIDFATALDTLDPLNRARAIEQLFGKFQFSRLSTLFQNVTKDGTQASRVLDLAGASVEELAILSERELGTVENAVGVNFKESVEKLKLSIAPIGKTFLEAVTPIVQVIGRLLDKFNNLGDGTKKFIVVATTLVGVIGPVLLMTFGLLANGVANIIKLFITMRSGFLKVGSNTTVLAQQTQYLNSEQLEAATVAASLNQAHTRLTQSFGLEASAIRILRQAYIDATIAATNFARANPGMMMPGFKPGMKGGVPKKFASGTTGLPGPKGAGDIVPVLGAPGEAIIPAKVAQDERFKPIINAMVNGKLQGYESGTTGIKVPNELNPTGQIYNAKTAKSAKDIQNFLNSLQKNPDGTYNYIDPEGKYSKSNIKSSTIAEVLRKRSQADKFTPYEIKTKLGLTKEGYKESTKKKGTTSAPQSIRDVINKSKEKAIPGFEIEKQAIENRLKQQGLGVRKSQLDRLFQVDASHIKPDFDQFGNKVWNLKNVAADAGYVNNYISNSLKGKLGQHLSQMSPKELKALGIDPSHFKELYSSGNRGMGTHPVSAGQAKTLQAIARYVISKPKGLNLGKNALYQAHALDAGLNARLTQTGFYSSGGPRTLEKLLLSLTPGERVKYDDGRSKNVNNQTGKRKTSNVKQIGGSLTDTRIIPGKGVKKVIPFRGFSPGPFAYGAAGGIDKNGVISQPGMAVSEIEKNTRATEKSIRRNMEKVQREQLTTIKEQNRLMMEQIKLQKEGVPLTAKEQKMRAKEIRSQKIGRVAGPTAGVLGMASMGAFMSGNSGIGMGLMGASAIASILPMLTSPLSIMVAALTAAVAGVYFWNKSLEQSAKKQAEFVKATSGTTQKMSEVGKITGAVGASEIMARRRETGPFGAYNDAQRAGSMFGDTFLQSDIGKTMAKGFVENMEKFGSKQAASDFALQLSTYVSDGVLTADQAAGIAEQIGIQLGNTRYAVQIQGDLRSIIGPNGENLAKDPLRVRTQIVTQATRRTERELSRLTEAQAKGNTGRNEAARVAAIAGNNLEIIKAQADATELLYQKQIDSLQKDLEKTTNLEKQLELKQKILNLESEQARDVSAFNNAFANQIDKELKIFNERILEVQDFALNNNLASAEKAYFDSLKSTVKDTYKGTAYESLATDALSKLAKLSDKTLNPFDKKTKGGFKTAQEAQTFEVQMSLLMKNKVINPEQSNALLDLFAGKLPQLQQTLNLGIRRQGAEKTVAMLDFFTQLNINKEKSVEISTKIINADPATFDKVGETLAALQALDGHEINMSAYVETVGYDGLVALANKLAIVEKMPTPITKESILKFYEEGGLVGTGVTKSQLELLMSKWQDFDALPDSLQKEAISKFITIYETKFADQAAKLSYMREEAARMAESAGGSSITQDVEYRRLMTLVGTDPTKLSSEFVAAQVRSYIGSNKALNTVPGAKGGGVGTGSRDTTLDDLLKKLKLTRDASINAEGGLQELRRVFKDSRGDMTKYVGLIQQLSNMGAESDFIDFIGGMDNAIQKGYVNIEKLKDGVVKLTTDGIAAFDLYQEAQLGAFSVSSILSIAQLQKQKNAFVALRDAGASAAEALEMVADADFAISLRMAKTSEEVKGLIEDYKNLKQQQQDTLLATDPKKYFEEQMSKAMRYFDVLERQSRNAYEPQIQAINDLIDANEKLIDAKQREIEINYDRPIAALNAQSTILNHDLSLIDKAAESINKKYDQQEEALNKIAEINNEIAAQEKRRITIADALTQGDISAAAKAIQDDREAAANATQQRNSELLKIAREKELASLTSSTGLTRIQIEEKLYDISQQVYTLEQKQIPVLEEIKKLQDANFNYQKNSLEPLKAKLEAEIASIDAQRKKWTDTELAIDIAIFKAEGYTGALLNAEEILLRIKGLWKDISDLSSSGASKLSGQKTTPQIAQIDSIAQGIVNKVQSISPEIIATKYISAAQAEQYLADQAITSQGLGPKAAGMLKGMFGMAAGGMVPKYFVSGGYSKGTDTIPAMLTPGEFVVKRNAVESFGVNKLNKINDGSYDGSSVYNYNLSVNVKSDANPNDIARTVMTQIKQIDSQRIRTQRGA